MKQYNDLFDVSSKEILAGNYVLDFQIDSFQDNRFGITLLIRPTEQIKNKIQSFLNELKEIDSNQYYYQNSDIHITVMSIISCYENFDLNTISVSDYVEIINKSLMGLNRIEINLCGVTVSPSAILIQGFPTDNSLNIFRNNLRNNFKNSQLEQSLDKRYSIFTAHSTVVRFREKIKKKEKLIQLLEKYRAYDFGKFEVDHLELVYNDWYQREKYVKRLYNFPIK